ncbi:hypothetical protein VT84_06535 [Gemmata sp. SH-PL17]|nr:hypothetical protein VT84_06535 [Gemmata sp. SH-PL17]
MPPFSYGHLVHCCLRDALTIAAIFFDRDWIAIIRSIDSITSPAQLENILCNHKITCCHHNGNIILPASNLQSALKNKIFTGFDEVWIARTPPALDLRAVPAATSDAANFSTHVPGEILQCALETNVAIILGDGCGLNYLSCNHQVQIYNSPIAPPTSS